jgi:hypothetical protein
MRHLADRDLWAIAADGDGAAFGVLFERHAWRPKLLERGVHGGLLTERPGLHRERAGGRGLLTMACRMPR